MLDHPTCLTPTTTALHVLRMTIYTHHHPICLPQLIVLAHHPICPPKLHCLNNTYFHQLHCHHVTAYKNYSTTSCAYTAYPLTVAWECCIPATAQVGGRSSAQPTGCSITSPMPCLRDEQEFLSVNRLPYRQAATSPSQQRWLYS